MTFFTLKSIKRIIVIVIGFTLLLIGIALLVLPGPGILVIILGLILLAGEFIWAKLLLRKFKKKAEHLKKSTFLGKLKFK